MISDLERHNLERLNAYRLDEDLSYEELSARTGVSWTTLHKLLTGAELNPWDRTLHKIKRFLEGLDAAAAAQAAAPVRSRRSAGAR